MLKYLILLLPCFVCLYAAITLFVNRKKNFRSQNIWMICMLFMSVSSYIWSIYYGGVEDFSLYYKLDVIDATLTLTLFPFLYLYIRSFTEATPLGWKEYSWFLPSFFIGSATLVLYLSMGEEQATAYIQQLFWDTADFKSYNAPVYKLHFAINVVLYYLVFMIQVVLVLKYTVSLIINYKKRIDDFYSNSEGKSLENIRGMLIGLFCLFVLFLLAILEMYTCKHAYPVLIYILSFLYAVILYYLNYHVCQVKYTAESLDENLMRLDKEAEEKGYVCADSEVASACIINSGRRQEILLNLNRFLDEDKIFLKNNLRLDDLVREIKVNRTYISMLINEEFQCSFSELINRRRIEYAKQLFISNPRLSHLQVSEQSGFVHASSFSRTFKQYAGITFREWQKQLKE